MSKRRNNLNSRYVNMKPNDLTELLRNIAFENISSKSGIDIPNVLSSNITPGFFTISIHNSRLPDILPFLIENGFLESS